MASLAVHFFGTVTQTSSLAQQWRENINYCFVRARTARNSTQEEHVDTSLG